MGGKDKNNIMIKINAAWSHVTHIKNRQLRESKRRVEKYGHLLKTNTHTNNNI